jgi:hypothetical protein
MHAHTGSPWIVKCMQRTTPCVHTYYLERIMHAQVLPHAHIGITGMDTCVQQTCLCMHQYCLDRQLHARRIDSCMHRTYLGRYMHTQDHPG